MKSKIVYITSDEANIITLLAGDSTTVTMHLHGPRHPHEPDGKHQLKKNDDIEHFVHEVALALEKEDARLLLVGPAQAKDRLKSHLESKHPNLAKKVVGVETMDKATGPQIVAFGRAFYTKLDVFDSL